MIVTLFTQVLIMFLLAGVGYVMYYCWKISNEGSKSLGNILICVSLPCVIINGFQVEKTAETMAGLLLSAVAAGIVLFLSIVIARLFFRKDAIASFAGAFSNPGFFGIPLIVAALSQGDVFYIAAFIAFLNMLQWTYGVAIMTNEKKSLSIKAVLKAPSIIAIIIGMVLFLTGMRLPFVASRCIEFIADLNTPLAMFSIGVYLAQTDVGQMLKRKSLYFISVIRLVLIPLVAMGVLCILPEQYQEMKLAVLIAAACPVGSNVAVYAQLHNCDYTYAVQSVVISTALSVVTLPVIIQLAMMVW